MARSENQGLQIALIIFVMITVALGVSTYIYFSYYQTAVEEKDKAQAQVATLNQRLTAQQNAVALLKRTVGATNDNEAALDSFRSALATQDPKLSEEIAAIEAKFDRDMQKFGAEFPVEKRNYVELPGYLISVIQKKNEAIAASRTQESKLRADLAQAESTAADKLATAEKDVARAQDDLDQYRVTFDNQLTTLTKTKDTIGADNSQKAREIKTMSDAHSKKVAELEDTIKQLSRINQALAARNEALLDPPFEDQPDGRVARMSTTGKVLWINLGIDDGLRRSVTFSILDKNAINLKDAPVKGSVEVTRVTGRHMAECRILNDDLKNPILPGDLVYSPSWKAGEKVHFALAGFMDYNGDGKSDRALLKNVITMNNGVVDAEIDEAGKRSGKITVDTRFLVIGQKPDESSDKEALQEYTTMLTQAENLGVETISMRKLLESMGFKGETRTVGLGGTANSGDFAPTARDGVQSTSPGQEAGGFKERFRPRTPPSRGDRGAF